MDVQNTLKNNLSRIDCRGKEENLSSRRGDNSYSCPSLSNSGRFLLHYILLTSLRGWGKTHLFNLNFSWRTENCVFMPWTKRILRIQSQNQSDVAELCKLVTFQEKSIWRDLWFTASRNLSYESCQELNFEVFWFKMKIMPKEVRFKNL